MSNKPQTVTDELLVSGKHLAVKLVEVYKVTGNSPVDCQAVREWIVAAKRAEKSKDEMLDALYAALPFVEDALTDPAYKAGAVAKQLNKIKEAIAKAEGKS